MTNLDPIDQLLSQPLAAIPDNGFSARVQARIAAPQRRRVALFVVAGVLAAMVFCMLVPLQTLAVELNWIVLKLGTSSAIGFAAAALVLTYVVDRQLSLH